MRGAASVLIETSSAFLAIVLGGGNGERSGGCDCLERWTGWPIEDLDLVEADEALAVDKDLGWKPEIFDVDGGAAIRSARRARGC